MNATAAWDVVCVGAGITSLAFAAQLSMRQPGIRVLVIEKHLVPGGYASVFRRPKQDAVFDCSLHKLSGMTGPGNLRRIFDDLGLIDELELVYPEHYFQASLPGKTVVLPNDAAQLEQMLSELYPEDRRGITQFFADVELHGKNSYFQFQMMNGSYDVPIGELIRDLRYAHKHLKPVSVDEAFRKMFVSPELREILSMPGCYVGGHPEDLGYLYFLHIVYATLYCGNAYVRGASQRLSDALVERIERCGGKVLLRTPVERIVVGADHRVEGVKTEDAFFAAKQVYVNAAPRYAVDELLDPALPLRAVKEKLGALRPSWATLTVYAVVDADPAVYGLECTETFLIDRFNDEAKRLRDEAAASADPELCELAYWKLSPIELTNYHALDADGGCVLVFNLLDTIGHWPQRRTPEYKKKKQRAIDVVLERLYERFPGFRGHVRYAEASSPRTYLRYTNNTDGAGFGAVVGTTLNPHVFHHNFPIGGLYFMSTWVAGASYEAAFAFAEHKALAWEQDAPKAAEAQALQRQAPSTLETR
jgi:all-trans-retinol 13,14-reductase